MKQAEKKKADTKTFWKDFKKHFKWTTHLSWVKPNCSHCICSIELLFMFLFVNCQSRILQCAGYLYPEYHLDEKQFLDMKESSFLLMTGTFVFWSSSPFKKKVLSCCNINKSIKHFSVNILPSTWTCTTQLLWVRELIVVSSKQVKWVNYLQS